MERTPLTAARHDDESDDDTDGFLLDGFETVPGDLLPFVEQSQRRRQARRHRRIATVLACAVAALLAWHLAG